MKPKLTYGVMVLAIAFTSACKKKSDPLPPPLTQTPVTYPNYSKLNVGNYWVYESFQVEQDGVATDMYQRDSCYIDKDTLIRDRVYFKLHKRSFIYGAQAFFLRDSLHYIIDSHGQILFSSQDFSTVFSTAYNIQDNSQIDPQDTEIDTLYKITVKMNDKDLTVTLPAGNFVTSNMQTTYLSYPYIISHNASYIDNPRHLNMRYAENVGLVLETEPFYTSAPYVTEKRLIRYHVN